MKAFLLRGQFSLDWLGVCTTGTGMRIVMDVIGCLSVRESGARRRVDCVSRQQESM